MKEIADKWRAANGYEGLDGVVVFFEGQVQGWMNVLRDPHTWRPGCIAVLENGREFVACGGNDKDGAEVWRSKVETNQKGKRYQFEPAGLHFTSRHSVDPHPDDFLGWRDERTDKMIFIMLPDGDFAVTPDPTEFDVTLLINVLEKENNEPS